MTADYNGVPGADAAALRTLAALISGRAASPPSADRRAALLEAARAHRIDRLAARALRERGEDLFTWFGRAAADLVDEHACATIDAVRERELRTVIDTLAAVEGASPVVFKGGALAHSHYPSPWLRPRLDTDILISPSAVAATLAALANVNYRQALTTPGTLVLSQASLSRTDEFGIEHALDLHWQIANWQVIAAVLSHGEIAARAVALSALGPHARAAADADALVLACLHRAAHHRDSHELLWIHDIHLLASRLSTNDWALAIATARRGGVTALCARGLSLTIDWFHSPVPPDVMRALDVSAEGAKEPSAVYLSSGQRLVDGLLSDLRALPPRMRMKLLAEHVFPPADYMRRRYNAGSRLSVALWYVRRLASGIPKWFATRSGP